MANEQYPSVFALGQSHGVGFLRSGDRHTNNPALAIDSDLHGENAVFPYRDLITQLKTTDSHFLNLYDKHNELDQRIRNMESGIEPATHLAIEALKKEKLALKDEFYQILRKASALISRYAALCPVSFANGTRTAP